MKLAMKLINAIKARAAISNMIKRKKTFRVADNTEQTMPIEVARELLFLMTGQQTKSKGERI